MRYKLALIISLIINIAAIVVLSRTYPAKGKVNLLELRVKSLENRANYSYKADKLATYERDRIVNTIEDLVLTLKATGVFFRDLSKPKELPVVECRYSKNHMRKSRKRHNMTNKNKMLWIGGRSNP
jgi:hypothetical protein